MMNYLNYWSQIKLMKIGITGSLSSGKSSVAKILSNNKKLLLVQIR